MVDRSAMLLVIALLVATLAGCGTTAPSSFYTLDSAATEANGPPVAAAVVVGPVSVPATVDRPEFVIAVAPNQVEIDEFHRWAAPLGDAVARTVAGDLAVLLGNADVATGPLANFQAVYRVTIAVQRFESVRGEAALVEAVWAVRATAGGAPRSGRTVAREAVQGDGFDALAAAHSRALARLSADVAAAIRAEAGQKR
jgi:uncharacterized lipoprotein YmbA